MFECDSLSTELEYTCRCEWSILWWHSSCGMWRRVVPSGVPSSSMVTQSEKNEGNKKLRTSISNHQKKWRHIPGHANSQQHRWEHHIWHSVFLAGTFKGTDNLSLSLSLCFSLIVVLRNACGGFQLQRQSSCYLHLTLCMTTYLRYGVPTKKHHRITCTRFWHAVLLQHVSNIEIFIREMFIAPGGLHNCVQ
jgi:hypothetical protein